MVHCQRVSVFRRLLRPGVDHAGSLKPAIMPLGPVKHLPHQMMDVVQGVDVCVCVCVC